MYASQYLILPYICVTIMSVHITCDITHVINMANNEYSYYT